MNKENYYSTEETVQRTGLSKDTIRYYEKVAIVGPIRRDSRNYRQYSEENIAWLNMVKLLREFGIPISELRNVQQTSYKEEREYLEGYQKQVKKQISKLHEID